MRKIWKKIADWFCISRGGFGESFPGFNGRTRAYRVAAMHHAMMASAGS